MAETKGPPAAHKIAMSRALGAAFLNHQVEQLEKSVSNGPASGNWRDRRQVQGDRNANAGARGGRRGAPPGIPRNGSKKGEGRSGERDIGHATRLSDEVTREQDKDADVVVVDASVLVNALPQVKKWCKDGREEVVIVPLEALNTLDLLKKGTSALAQKARAASRVLEAQVGANPRIRVQRDDAFVPWDNVSFNDVTDVGAPALPQHFLHSCPEWVRRTICCAKWETDKRTAADGKQPQKVVLAVIVLAAAGAALDTPSGEQGDAVISPVPLPAPNANKFEPRTAGAVVKYWAAKAGVKVFEMVPAPAHTLGKVPSDDERLPKKGGYGYGRGRGTPHYREGGVGGLGGGRDAGGRGGAPSMDGGGGLVERPPAVKAMMQMVAQPSTVVRVLARGEKLEPDS